MTCEEMRIERARILRDIDECTDADECDALRERLALLEYQAER